jgi:pseudoazurin|tara:strand:- start:1870 stop:2292 length:423 start_codon:yes stop_codon:yes gene_type:complete
MKYILIFFIFLWSTYTTSAEVTVEMLNKLDKEYMVYSKKIVRININETVLWKATDKGHNVEFIKNAIPEGVENFKSKYNIDVEYKFTIPGIYAYWCTPHKSMGMIGFIIVDDDKSNLKMIRNVNYFGRSKKVAKLLIDKF